MTGLEKLINIDIEGSSTDVNERSIGRGLQKLIDVGKRIDYVESVLKKRTQAPLRKEEIYNSLNDPFNADFWLRTDLTDEQKDSIYNVEKAKVSGLNSERDYQQKKENNFAQTYSEGMDSHNTPIDIKTKEDINKILEASKGRRFTPAQIHPSILTQVGGIAVEAPRSRKVNALEYLSKIGEGIKNIPENLADALELIGKGRENVRKGIRYITGQDELKNVYTIYDEKGNEITSTSNKEIADLYRLQGFNVKSKFDKISPLSAGLETTARGTAQQAAGALKGMLQSIPAVAAYTAIQPLAAEIGGEIAENLGYDKRKGEEITNKILPFAFGPAVGIGSLLSEEGIKKLEEAGAFDKLKPQDREIAKELISNGLFFGTVIGIKAGKVKLDKNLEKKLNKEINEAFENLSLGIPIQTKPIIPSERIPQSKTAEKVIEAAKYTKGRTQEEKEIIEKKLEQLAPTAGEIFFGEKRDKIETTEPMKKGIQGLLESSEQKQIKALADKIAEGEKEFTQEELQLQKNYPELLEQEVNKLKEGISRKGIQQTKEWIPTGSERENVQKAKEILTKKPTAEVIKEAKDKLGKNFETEFNEYLKLPNNKARISSAEDKELEKGLLLEDFSRRTLAADLLNADIDSDLYGLAEQKSALTKQPEVIGANRGRAIKIKLPKGEEKIFVMGEGTHKDPMAMAFRYLADDFKKQGIEEKEAENLAEDYITQAAINDEIDIGDYIEGKFISSWKKQEHIQPKSSSFEIPLEKEIQRQDIPYPKEEIPTETKIAEIKEIPIKDIKTDEGRFQNRATSFSEETASSIEKNYNPAAFDPIIVWKDPKDNNIYVLAGHSRLEGMKRRGAKTIPAKFFEGTEREAINYAIIESNRKATQEDILADIRAYKKAKSEGYSKQKLLELFKKESKIKTLENYSHLDENGQFLSALNSESAKTYPYLERNASWVGELRKMYPQLTDGHEQELFDYFYRDRLSHSFIKKEELFDKIEDRVTDVTFNKYQKLALDKLENAGARARSDTRDIQLKIDLLKARNRELKKLSLGAPEEQKKIFQKEIISNIEEIKKLESNINEIVNSQFDIFEQLNQELKEGGFNEESGSQIVASGDPEELEKLAEDLESKAETAGRISTEELRKEINKSGQILFQRYIEYNDNPKNEIEISLLRAYNSFDNELPLREEILDNLIRNRWIRKTQDEEVKRALISFLKEFVKQGRYESYDNYIKRALKEKPELITSYIYLRSKLNEAVRKREKDNNFISDYRREIERKEKRENLSQQSSSIEKENKQILKQEHTSKNIFNAAKEEFGTTQNIRKAGYILPDGSMLDFSGGEDKRYLDHTEIRRLNTSIEDFIDKGAIRFMPEADAFYFTRMPTVQQMKIIKKIADIKDGYITLGIGEDFYREYDKGTKTDEIISDIENYFIYGKSKSKIDEIRKSKDYQGEREELFQLWELERTPLQELQDRRRHLQYIIESDKSSKNEKIKAEEELKKVEIQLKKLREQNNQLNIFEAEQGNLFQQSATQPSREKFQNLNDYDREIKLKQSRKNDLRTVYSKMSEGQRRKFLDELVKGIDKEWLIGQKDLTKEQAKGLTDLLEKAILFDPEKADLTTAWEESFHASIVTLARPYLARNLLRENGWDGKGEIWDVKNNESLRNAHENLAKKYIEWRKRQEENPAEPKTRLEKLFQLLRELWAKIASFLNKIGFKTEAGYFYDLATGKLRKSNEKVSDNEFYNELAKSQTDFEKSLEDFKNGKLTKPAKVTTTPEILVKLGAEQLPVIITPETIAKVIHKHQITYEQLKDLPVELHDPIMVFQSATRPNSFVIMTELRSDKGNIVAAIHLSKREQQHFVNKIASVYIKERDKTFIEWIDKGLLRYYNKNKSQIWLRSAGLRLPMEVTKSGSTKILTEDDLINNKLMQKISEIQEELYPKDLKYYMDRIATIKNIYELKNWRKKHEAEIEELPAWERDDIINAWNEQHRLFTGERGGWEAEKVNRKYESKYEGTKEEFKKYLPQASELFDEGYRRYADFSKKIKERAGDISPDDILKLFRETYKAKLREYRKSKEEEGTIVEPKADLTDKKTEELKNEIKKILINKNMPKKLQEEILRTAEEIINNPKNRLGKYSKIRALTEFGEKIKLMTLKYGAAGAELAQRIAHGTKNRMDIIERYYEIINKIEDVYDKIKSESGEQEIKRIEAKIIKALEDRDNVKEILKSDIEKELYELYLKIYGGRNIPFGFYNEIKKAGYKVRSDYFPHIIRDSFIIDEIISNPADVMEINTKGLNNFISANSRYLNPREFDIKDIRRDLLGITKNYIFSVSKALAYKDAVNYYYTDFKNDIPPLLKKQSMRTAIQYMRSVLDPEIPSRNLFMRMLRGMRNAEYTNFLSFSLKNAVQNYTQKDFAKLYMTPEAVRITNKIFYKYKQATGNLLNAIYEASHETPRYLELSMEDIKRSRLLRINEKIRKVEPFQLAELSNWKYAELGGIIDYVIKQPEYKRLRNKGLSEIEAINKVLENRDTFDTAVRNGMDLASQTQISPSAAYRPSLFDKELIRFFLMFKRFPIATLEHISQTIFTSMKGAEGLRAQRILRRGLSENVKPVEMLRAAELYRKAAELMIKNYKNYEEEFGISDLKEYHDWLKKQEESLNKTIEKLEPMRNKSQIIYHWSKYWAKAALISSAFSFIYDLTDAMFYNLIHGEEEKDRLMELLAGENLTEKEKERLINKLIAKTLFDISPLPFYALNPQNFAASPLLPKVEIFPYGDYSNWNKRGITKSLTSYGLNVVPGLGLVDRVTGRAISKKITDWIVPEEEKEKTKIMIPKINIERASAGR